MPVSARGLRGRRGVRPPEAAPLTLATAPRTAAARPLSGRDIVCFSHDWSGDPLSKTHFMRLLARENRILWVNSIGYRTPSLASGRDLRRIVQKVWATTDRVREVEPNLFVLNPLSAPTWGGRATRFVGSRLLRWHVRRTMCALGFRRPINWVFNPAAAVVARQLSEDFLIYHCVDEYTAFRGVSTGRLATLEQSLINRADLVIVSADRLLEAKRSPHAPTVLVRHGVDFEHFRSACNPALQVPDELARLPRPVIGYFGLIADDWIDIPLLIHLARSLRHASVVMLGKVTMDVSALAAEPNVYLLGRKPYSTLPAYCKGFDVAIIPFPVTPVTESSNPLKAREYLAAGLPVVSTAIPEVEHLSPPCQIAHDREEFVRAVRQALAYPGPDRDRGRVVENESWAARLGEIRNHVARVQSVGGSHGR